MAIQIDADAFFRALTATGFKLLAYHLNLETGAISTRTLRPDEVQSGPLEPSVKPLPKIGGDLAPKKDALPFGPAPAVEAKNNLFGDAEPPKKRDLKGEFWEREEKKKPSLFDEEFKRERGEKKLAEIFGQPAKARRADPFAQAAPSAQTAPQAQPAALPQAPADDPKQPRIPAASEKEQEDWMRAYARDCGDPEIREQLQKALKSAKPSPAFLRAVAKHQRLNQQWERYYRKTALAFGEAWLAALGVECKLNDR
jgi:hypothetical protein